LNGNWDVASSPLIPEAGPATWSSTRVTMNSVPCLLPAGGVTLVVEPVGNGLHRQTFCPPSLEVRDQIGVVEPGFAHSPFKSQKQARRSAEPAADAAAWPTQSIFI